ncbi:unnamed protein product [Boreogadus saida]
MWSKHSGGVCSHSQLFDSDRGRCMLIKCSQVTQYPNQLQGFRPLSPSPVAHKDSVIWNSAQASVGHGLCRETFEDGGVPGLRVWSCAEAEPACQRILRASTNWRPLAPALATTGICHVIPNEGKLFAHVVGSEAPVWTGDISTLATLLHITFQVHPSERRKHRFPFI